MDTVEVNGLTIAFERAGSGSPLVLLHGGMSDHREWRAQLDGLSDAFTVVAWDAPGAGASSDPPETFRMPDYASTLAAFTEALEFGKVHVLGLSWGSTLALELYRLRPDIPRTLTLASACAGWAGSLTPATVAERLRAGLRDLDALTPETYARTWVPSLFTPRAAREVVEGYVCVMSEFHPAGARAMLRSMAEADLRPVLPEIGVPTLLLYGEQDARSPLTVAEEMHAKIAGSALVVLPEVGHMGNLEAPEAFNAAVGDFLRAHAERDDPS